jgi:magnesium chelatase family protein
MHLQVPAVDVTELSKRSERETSDIIKKRVESARRRQKENLKDYNINMNAELPTSVLHDHSQITSEAKNFLKKAARTLNLSARSYYRVLKLSLTISDLGGSDTVTEEHVAEALTYRPQNFLDL